MQGEGCLLLPRSSMGTVTKSSRSRVYFCPFRDSKILTTLDTVLFNIQSMVLYMYLHDKFTTALFPHTSIHFSTQNKYTCTKHNVQHVSFVMKAAMSPR